MTLRKRLSLLAMATAMTVTGAAFGAEQERDVPEFSQIVLKGSMDVYATVGKKASVRVVADGEIIDKIETEVEDDTLIVKLKRGRYHDIGEMKVYVTSKKLSEVHLKGSGDVEVQGTVKADRFEASIYGSGDIDLEKINVENLEVNVRGSGDLNVSGSCDTIRADIKGSGDIRAEKVKCDTADVDIKGSGDVTVYASKSLEATIMGSGDITVYGNPGKIRSRAMGSGEIYEK